TEVEPFREHDLGNVLDAFHQVDEIGLAAGANRREAYPAITEDRRRHTVPRRGRHRRVPGCLTAENGSPLSKQNKIDRKMSFMRNLSALALVCVGIVGLSATINAANAP